MNCTIVLNSDSSIHSNRMQKIPYPEASRFPDTVFVFLRYRDNMGIAKSKDASLGKKKFYRILTIHYNCMTKKHLSREHKVHGKDVLIFIQKLDLS